TQTHTYTHTQHTHTHACALNTHTHTHKDKTTYRYTQTHTHTPTHTHTHTPTHTHTHACQQLTSPFPLPDHHDLLQPTESFALLVSLFARLSTHTRSLSLFSSPLTSHLSPLLSLRCPSLPRLWWGRRPPPV